MTKFTCQSCDRTEGDVRLVEHGTDDVPLCKACFLQIRRTIRLDWNDYEEEQ